MTILEKPSFIANGIQGLLILIVLLLCWMYWKDLMKMTIYQKIIFILIFGVVIGIHGLLHLGLESVYDWNPLEGKWI